MITKFLSQMSLHLPKISFGADLWLGGVPTLLRTAPIDSTFTEFPMPLILLHDLHLDLAYAVTTLNHKNFVRIAVARL